MHDYFSDKEGVWMSKDSSALTQNAAQREVHTYYRAPGPGCFKVLGVINHFRLPRTGPPVLFDSLYDFSRSREGQAIIPKKLADLLGSYANDEEISGEQAARYVYRIEESGEDFSQSGTHTEPFYSITGPGLYHSQLFGIPSVSLRQAWLDSWMLEDLLLPIEASILHELGDFIDRM